MSDSSSDCSDSSLSDNGCSSADEQEPARKKQASEPATVARKKRKTTQKSCESPPPQSYKEEKANGDLEGYWKHPVASKAAEFWAQLESKGGCFKCPEWIKLAELVVMPGSVEDGRKFSALKYLKSPQRNSLKEKHTDMCARGLDAKKEVWVIRAIRKCWLSVVGGLATGCLDFNMNIGGACTFKCEGSTLQHCKGKYLLPYFAVRLRAGLVGGPNIKMALPGLFSATNGALYQTRTLHTFYRILKVLFVELLPPLCEMQPAEST
eukprot:744905-Pelagomonas_calceolata.AAC.3